MSEPQSLQKAVLEQLSPDLKQPSQQGKKVTVQFNPDTLKLSFSNQVATPGGAGTGSQSEGTAGRQFVGAGTTKLSLQLWFDATAALEGQSQVDDVRRLTQEVVFFITPDEVMTKDGKKILPPGVRFQWGSFIFDGLVDSLEETIDFFSPEGKPLRASVSLGLSQQKIFIAKFEDSKPGFGIAPGTRPLAEARTGATLPGMASTLGRGQGWQAIAEANGIENPRLLQPGQLIDLNAAIRTPRV